MKSTLIGFVTVYKILQPKKSEFEGLIYARGMGTSHIFSQKNYPLIRKESEGCIYGLIVDGKTNKKLLIEIEELIKINLSTDKLVKINTFPISKLLQTQFYVEETLFN